MEYVFVIIGGGIGGVLVWLVFNKKLHSLTEEKRQADQTITRLETKSQILGEAEDKLRDAFENLANKILDQKVDRFDAQAKKSLEPFRRDLDNLKQSVDQSHKERFSLGQQIERIGKEANDLAHALTHRPQMRGHWGEVVLKNMLEDAGLREGSDYVAQPSLKSEEQQRARPDIILHLPENKHLVIDSKLSLVSYEHYISEQNEALRQSHLTQFLAATKQHIDDLAHKNYAHAGSLNAPDFTIMFMPIEGAYITAITAEKKDLHQYAWHKKIVIVSPSTLFATLRTIASLWRLDKQNKHSKEIAKQGGALYDKIAGFIEDMEKLGNQLDTAKHSYDKSMNKLKTGKGNILSRTENLKALGAITSKQLPDVEE